MPAAAVPIARQLLALEIHLTRLAHYVALAGAERAFTAPSLEPSLGMMKLMPPSTKRITPGEQPVTTLAGGQLAELLAALQAEAVRRQAASKAVEAPKKSARTWLARWLKIRW
jgi:hypothetical protein